jgi:Bacteriophage tail sheath protein
MPEYLAPGVYVEEIDAGVVPIEGVSTSTAGFVGAAEMGPTRGRPQLVTSFSEFTRSFGSFLPETPANAHFLAYAVDGFFRNGGRRVYVLRVVGAGSAASGRTLNNGWRDPATNANFLLTTLAQPAGQGPTELMLTSSRGVVAGTTIRVRERTGPTVSETQYTAATVDGDRVLLQAPSPGGPHRRGAVVLIPGPAGFTLGPALTVSARSDGLWGDRLRVAVMPSSRTQTRLLAVDVSATVQARPLTATLTIANVTSTTSVDLGAGEARQLRLGDRLQFSDGAVQRVVTLTGIGPNDAVSWAAAEAFPGGYTPTSVAIDANPPAQTIGIRASGAPATNVSAVTDAAPDLAVGQQVVVADASGANAVNATIAAKTSNTSFRLDMVTGRDYAPGATIRLVGAALGQRVRVFGAANLYVGASVELTHASTQRLYATVLAIDGDIVRLDQPVPASFVPGDALRTLEFDLAITLQPSTPREQERSETFRQLSLAPGAPNFAATVVADGSQLVTVAAGAAAPDLPVTIDRDQLVPFRTLQGGNDGAAPQPVDVAGDPAAAPGNRNGIRSLEDIDQVSIIAAPGQSDPFVHGALIEQCERLRDRFAVLDPRPNRTPDQVAADRSAYDTRYAGLYYPWLVATDPRSGREITLPPSGHIVGIYARVDVERGVHKAPANEVVRGISDLELLINKEQQDILNPPPNQINVIRDFRADGRGLRVWGARCITSASQWKYVNVRRLFIFLEESIDEGTQWVVFEPNEEPLWQRVIQSVSAFLTRVWRDGALQGTAPEQAFFVRCDRSTMTQDDIDNGRLIILIGVAPVMPAEFVIIRISQQTGLSAEA